MTGEAALDYCIVRIALRYVATVPASPKHSYVLVSDSQMTTMLIQYVKCHHY